MADIPLQQRSGVEDVGRTIVPLPGLALEPVYNAAANVQKQTTADFEAQQMEKVKVKTIAAQNALNLLAEENRRNGLEPLRVQAVVGGDTFANRAFLKTAQEISRVMTIDQVHTDLQAELTDLHTKYLTSGGQLDYDPKHPEADGAARFRAASFAILEKYHKAYAGSPFVDDAFDAQMTAKFTGTVNTLAQQVKETQATKVVANYQTGLLEKFQQVEANILDAKLIKGFASTGDYKAANKVFVEPQIIEAKELLRLMDASGLDSSIVRAKLLGMHDRVEEQFKNGVFLELLQLPATTPTELAAKTKKISDFVDFINHGGLFYENQIIQMPKGDEFDAGSGLERSINNLYKLNAAQGNEAYNREFPSEEAFKATVATLLPYVKDSVTKDRIIEKYNATLVELDVSRKRMAGDKIGRKDAIDKMFRPDAEGNLPGFLYREWADEIQKRDNELVPDRDDPVAIAVLDPKNGDHIISKAHQTLMTHVTDALAAGNPIITDLAVQVNQQRTAQGLKPYDVKTAEGADAFARDVADQDIGVYAASIAEQNRQRALNEWKDDPSVVTDNSRLPNATYKAASADLYEAAQQPDKSSFLRQANNIAKVFVSTNGAYALDSDFEKLDGDVKAGDVGVGSMLKVASHTGEITDPSTAQLIQTWWASSQEGSVDEESAANIKVNTVANIIKDYSGELEAMGAGKVGSQEQYVFVNKMLQGIAYSRLQGVSGGGVTGDAQRELVTPTALADYAELQLKTVTEKVRKGTVVSENKGLGGQVWRLPDFVRSSTPDIKALSYVTSPIAPGESQMARDIGASYDHLDLTQYKPVVVGNKIRFVSPTSSPYDTKYLTWLPGGTPATTDKFTPEGSKLKLLPPVTGKPIEYSLEGFTDAINAERRAIDEMQQDSWRRMQQLMEFPSDTPTTEKR